MAPFSDWKAVGHSSFELFRECCFPARAGAFSLPAVNSSSPRANVSTQFHKRGSKHLKVNLAEPPTSLEQVREKEKIKRSARAFSAVHERCSTTFSSGTVRLLLFRGDSGVRLL